MELPLASVGSADGASGAGQTQHTLSEIRESCGDSSGELLLQSLARAEEVFATMLDETDGGVRSSTAEGSTVLRKELVAACDLALRTIAEKNERIRALEEELSARNEELRLIEMLEASGEGGEKPEHLSAALALQQENTELRAQVRVQAEELEQLRDELAKLARGTAEQREAEQENVMFQEREVLARLREAERLEREAQERFNAVDAEVAAAVAESLRRMQDAEQEASQCRGRLDIQRQRTEQLQGERDSARAQLAEAEAELSALRRAAERGAEAERELQRLRVALERLEARRDADVRQEAERCRQEQERQAGELRAAADAARREAGAARAEAAAAAEALRRGVAADEAAWRRAVEAAESDAWCSASADWLDKMRAALLGAAGREAAERAALERDAVTGADAVSIQCKKGASALLARLRRAAELYRLLQHDEAERRCGLEREEEGGADHLSQASRGLRALAEADMRRFAYLGLDISEGIRTTTGDKYTQSGAVVPDGGVLVVQVNHSGPAHLAGLRRGDVITALAGKPTPDKTAFKIAYASVRPRSTVRVELLRRTERSAEQGGYAVYSVEVHAKAAREEMGRLKERVDYKVEYLDRAAPQLQTDARAKHRRSPARGGVERGRRERLQDQLRQLECAVNGVGARPRTPPPQLNGRPARCDSPGPGTTPPPAGSPAPAVTVQPRAATPLRASAAAASSAAHSGQSSAATQFAHCRSPTASGSASPPAGRTQLLQRPQLLQGPAASPEGGPRASPGARGAPPPPATTRQLRAMRAFDACGAVG